MFSFVVGACLGLIFGAAAIYAKNKQNTIELLLFGILVVLINIASGMIYLIPK